MPTMDSNLQQLISPGRQQGCFSVSSFKFAPQAFAAIAEYLNLSDNSEISVIADLCLPILDARLNITSENIDMYFNFHLYRNHNISMISIESHMQLTDKISYANNKITPF